MSRRAHVSQWSDGAAGPVLAAERDDAWQERARCAETDPEIFYPEKGGSTRDAKLVCRYCDVREQCLQYALEHDERFGIWGGLSERDRRVLKTTRRREAA